jgi:hypothetical protein
MKIILMALFLFSVGLFGINESLVEAEKADEKFIQGTWQLRGENDGHAWFLEWTFDQGKFNLKGYPPLYQEGKYRIVKTEGNKMTLELYDQQGNFGTENRRIEVISDKSKDTLMIDDKGPFTRTKAGT